MSKIVETNDSKVVNNKTKKMYSKEMLMQLQEHPFSWKEPSCIEKLVGFRILRQNVYRRAPTTRFMPRVFNARSSVKTTRQRVIHYHVPEGDAIGLKTCSNPWTPSCLRDKRPNLTETWSDDNAQTEVIEKKFRSILNKITPENMAQLTNSITLLSINTDNCLKKVIDILFQKAINEPHFSPQYAYICTEMNKKDIKSKVKTTTESFKKLIILCCEDRFNSMHAHEQKLAKSVKEINDCKDQDDKEQMQLKYDLDEKVHRDRSVGNCRFMCELYKEKLLSNQTLELCIKHLLMSPKEETLECACNIIKQIGKTLNHKGMFEVLNEYASLAYKTRIPTRIRFMIFDTIELKDNNWTSRKHRTVQKSCDMKTPENNHFEPAKHKSMLSTNYGPTKNDDLARNMGTRDLSRPTRTSDVVERNVTLMYSCLNSETKNTNIQSSNNKDNIIVETEKKFLSILNKITAENIAQLAESIISLPIKTDDCLKKVVEMLFQKAIDEPRFSPQCAHICLLMKNIEVNLKDQKRDTTTFRKVLVRMCQNAFKSIIAQKRIMVKYSDEKTKELTQEKSEQNEIVYRKRSIGHCRFISELLKVKILVPEILDSCVEKLVKSPEEVSLECLCVILKHVGKELDHYEVFEKLHVYSSEHKSKLSARIRYMIQDTIDLKNNGWVQRNHFDEQ